MPTFEQRTGIGKPPRRRQKPVAAPKGPKPTKQRATPKAKRSSPAKIRQRATIPGKGLPHIAVPGATKKPKTLRELARVGLLANQPKLSKPGKNLPSEFSYTPPKYGPAGQTTLGERIVTNLTGVSPTSQKPGSLSNAAITSALALASVGGSEIVAGTKAAASVLKAGGAASDAARAAEEAANAAKVTRAAEAAGKPAATTEADQKAFYARKLRTPEQTATRSERAAKAVKGTPKRIVRRAKAAPKAGAKKAFSAPSAESRTARALGGTSEGARAIAGIGLPAKAHFVGNVLSSEVNALRKDTGRTLGTTARVAEQVPSALITPFQAAGQSIASRSTAPLGGVAKQYLDYAALYAKLGGPQGTAIAENQLGLLPVATGLLGGYGAKKAYRGARPKLKVAKLDRKTAALVDEVHNTTEGTTAHDTALRKLEEHQAKEPHRGRQRGRRREGQRAGVTGQQLHGHLHREMRARGQRVAATGGRTESYPELVHRLSRRPINERITHADVIQYIARHGYTAETHDLAGKLERDKQAIIAEQAKIDRKRAKKGQAPLVITKASSTLNVIDALQAHPEVFRDRGVMEAAHGAHAIEHGPAGRSVEAHRMRTGEHQTTGEPKFIAPTEASQMAAEGVFRPHERHPHELRHIPEAPKKGEPRVKGQDYLPRRKQGQDMERKIRTQAKSFRARAEKLRNQADRLLTGRRSPDGRSVEPPSPENVKLGNDLQAQANRLHARAQERLAVIDRMKVAEQLDIEAARIEAGREPGLGPQDAANRRRDAAALRTAHINFQEQRLQESMAQMEAIRQQESLAPPTYFPQRNITREQAPSGREFPSQKAAKRMKFKKGSLETAGKVDESALALIEGIVKGRGDLAMLHHQQSYLQDAPFVHNGQRFFYPEEIAQMRRDGIVPRRYNVATRAAEHSGAIHRHDALLKDYQAARTRGKALGLKGEPKILVSKAQDAEFHSQQDQIGTVLRSLRVITRAQGFAMLGTSLSWAAFQIPANPAAIIAHHWSPARYARVAKKYALIYKHADSIDRSSYENEIGANSGDIFTIGNPMPSSKNLYELSRAQALANKSPLGQAVLGIGDHIRKGGPIAATIRAYEKKTRMFASLMELDRMTGLKASGEKTVLSHAASEFIGHTSAAYSHIFELQKLFEGHHVSEWPTILAHNPEVMRKVETQTYNILGDYASLTKAERNIAAVTLFYPFVRYSIRFLLYALPKDHPFKAVIAYNAAQSNEIVLQKLLKGRPNFLQSFGNVITYDSQGKPQLTGLNLGRAAPGGNAVLEALGSGKLDLSTVLQPLSPLLSAPLLGLAHMTAFGSPTTVPAGIATLRALAALSPVTRPLTTRIGPPPSFTARLFRAINQSPTNILGTETPRLTTDLARQRDAVRAQKLLNVAYGPIQHFSDVTSLPIPKQAAAKKQLDARNKAWKELGKLALKYGVETPKQQKHSKQVRSKRSSHAYSKYGIFGTGKPKSSGSGLSLGGTSSGGGLTLGGSTSSGLTLK